MEQLRTAFALLMFASCYGLGLLLVLVAAVPLARRREPQARAAWLLPALWVGPVLLGGLFVQPGPFLKTAPWLGGLSLAAFLAFCLLGMALVLWDRTARAPIAWFTAANAPFAFLSMPVLAMASTGDWL